MEFIQRALPLRAERGTVVMLLRINFLAGQDRACFMRVHTPSTYVAPRPSFDGKGSDATEYGWFVSDDCPPTVVILDTELRDTKTALSPNLRGQIHDSSR
jgi:hypothetical protein